MNAIHQAREYVAKKVNEKLVVQLRKNTLAVGGEPESGAAGNEMAHSGGSHG
jgi:hypothetical protein